jgi:hypothetical protein
MSANNNSVDNMNQQNNNNMVISGPMDISSPYNTRHVTHVGFDANTGEFTGLPREWHTLLKASGITQIEQEQNPQVRSNNKHKNLFSSVYILKKKLLKKIL